MEACECAVNTARTVEDVPCKSTVMAYHHVPCSDQVWPGKQPLPCSQQVKLAAAPAKSTAVKEIIDVQNRRKEAPRFDSVGKSLIEACHLLIFICSRHSCSCFLHAHLAWNTFV